MKTNRRSAKPQDTEFYRIGVDGFTPSEAVQGNAFG